MVGTLDERLRRLPLGIRKHAFMDGDVLVVDLPAETRRDLELMPNLLRQLANALLRFDQYVYFIQCQETKRVKIGLSQNVDDRLAALQLGCPTELRLLVAIPGSRKFEAFFHQEFADCRLHGEWFEYTPRLQAQIAELVSEER